MSSTTPWADASSAYPVFKRLMTRQRFLAALDRALTTAETKELTRVNEQINNWQRQLGLE